MGSAWATDDEQHDNNDDDNDAKANKTHDAGNGDGGRLGVVVKRKALCTKGWGTDGGGGGGRSVAVLPDFVHFTRWVLFAGRRRSGGRWSAECFKLCPGSMRAYMFV